MPSYTVYSVFLTVYFVVWLLFYITVFHTSDSKNCHWIFSNLSDPFKDFTRWTLPRMQNITVDRAGRESSQRIHTSQRLILPRVSPSASLVFWLTSDTAASRACFCAALCSAVARRGIFWSSGFASSCQGLLSQQSTVAPSLGITLPRCFPAQNIFYRPSCSL